MWLPSFSLCSLSVSSNAAARCTFIWLLRGNRASRGPFASREEAFPSQRRLHVKLVDNNTKAVMGAASHAEHASRAEGGKLVTTLSRERAQGAASF